MAPSIMGHPVDSIILQPYDIGNILRLSVIKSCCGNIIHSILENNEENPKTFSLLPGFEMMSETDRISFGISWDENCLKTSHMDHVTYVCQAGDSRKILQWYHDIFKMKRFLVGPQVCTLDLIFWQILTFLEVSEGPLFNNFYLKLLTLAGQNTYMQWLV